MKFDDVLPVLGGFGSYLFVMKFDDVLPVLGGFGSYQKRIYFLVCLPAIVASYLTFISVFILYSPPHRCSIPGLDNDTYAIRDSNHRQLINETMPFIDGAYSMCTVYAVDDVTNSSAKGDNSGVSECSSWVYDASTFTSTIVEELDLVCQRRSYRSHANMVFMVGNIFGLFAQSIISDLFGRKKAFMASLFLLIISGFLNYFISDLASLIIIRFLNGASTTVFVAGFVIGMELVAPSKRVYAGMIIEIFWCMGMFIMAGVVYFLRDWQHLVLALACPPVLFLSYWWIIPESPRWLLSKGRKEEAMEIIKKAAEVNKVTLPKHLLDEGLDVRNGKDESTPKAKLSEMFTNRTLAVRCLIILYLWAVASLTYYGLTLNVSNLSGDVILNFVLSALVELAGYILALVLLNKLGRKILQCGFYLVGGLALVVSIFPVLYADQNAQWTLITLSLIGKMGSSGAFAVIYTYTAELYPTPLRNTGMGASTASARIGAALAPYVADLGLLVQGPFGEALPLLVFGVTAVVAGLLTFCLPETLNRNLPETIEDAKNFTKYGTNRLPISTWMGGGRGVTSTPSSRAWRRLSEDPDVE